MDCKRLGVLNLGQNQEIIKAITAPVVKKKVILPRIFENFLLENLPIIDFEFAIYIIRAIKKGVINP